MCSIAFVIQLRMPSSSFLPAPYSHHYPIAKTYSKSVAYLSCEFAIDQSFKIYAGGLGFLAGSHMRSAADLGQNLAGVGILWTYGYYNQVRGDEGELAVQFRKQHYSFLQETGIRFTVDVHGHPVWVRAYHLPGEVFGTVPMFFLSTDVDENDFLSRQITHRLYDNDELRRIAQYMILGIGAAKLFDVLGVSPEIMHLNEAHGLSAAFHLLKKHGNLEEVRNRLVFTTHTPEEAGNEKHHFSVLRDFGFFSGLDEPWVRDLAGVEGDVFNHTLAALRMAKKANGVSKLHGQVSRKMWKHARGICEITHVTNAQNKKFWADHGMERARVDADADALTRRKRELKSRLFRIVADQTGKLFDTGILTLVWARRFAGYKRPDLITRDLRLFREMLGSSNYPVHPVMPLVFNILRQQMTANPGIYQGRFSSVTHPPACSGKPGVRSCQKSGHPRQIDRRQGQISGACGDRLTAGGDRFRGSRGQIAADRDRFSIDIQGVRSFGLAPGDGS